MSLASGTMEGIGALLERYGKISVPVYQRNYAWDVEQVRELLNDVFGCVQSGRSHFLGCLILQETTPDKTECEVVDGQQRITSVLIILARIQDELVRLKTAGLQEIPGDGDQLSRTPSQEVQKLIFNGAYSKPRFVSNPLISDMFREKILHPNRTQQPPERDTLQKAITLPLRKAFWEVRDRIEREVSQIQGEEEQLRYLALLHDVVKSLQVLCITTTSADESLDVFLTLNNRGLPLGPSDIIRGQLIQALTEGLSIELVKEIHTKVFREWQVIMKSFDEAGEQQNSIDQFFRYYLLATGTQNVVSRRAPKEMDLRIRYKDRENLLERNLEERRAEANRIWKEIQTYAETWITLLQPPSDFNEECSYQLKILRAISDNYRVLLLNVFNPNHNVGDADKTEIARLCAVLSLRWYLNGQGAQDLESTFQQLGADFIVGSDSNQLMLALRLKAQISPALDARFKEGVKGFAKAILHGIERSIALKIGANPMPWNSTDVHVEHIAPDSSTDEWIDALYPLGDTSDEYDEVVEQLGNLTLLDKKMNVRLQQSVFSVKADKYINATSIVTRDIGTLVSWTLSEISNRQKWLIEMFDVVWSTDTPDSDHLFVYTQWKALPKAL